MMNRIVDWLIERRLKQLEIPMCKHVDENIELYHRVSNTLRRNHVMTMVKTDGIYIRLAGDYTKGECSSEMVRIISL